MHVFKGNQFFDIFILVIILKKCLIIPKGKSNDRYYNGQKFGDTET